MGGKVEYWGDVGTAFLLMAVFWLISWSMLRRTVVWNNLGRALLLLFIMSGTRWAVVLGFALMQDQTLPKVVYWVLQTLVAISGAGVAWELTRYPFPPPPPYIDWRNVFSRENEGR